MSHFVVMIIGNDVEEQLAPYHEFECTGINDQYVQDIDQTAEVLEQLKESESLNDALEYFGLDQKTIYDESQIDREGNHKYGYAILNKDSSLKLAINRTNPNRRWDWWVVGGRWTGYFRVKPDAITRSQRGERSWASSDEPLEPTQVDICLKGDVDLESLLNEQIDRLTKRHNLFTTLTTEEDRKAFVTWDTVRESHADIDVARAIYHAQAIVKAMNQEREKFGFFSDPDELLVPLDGYIKTHQHDNFVPFAFIKDSKWYEKGTMGWFACVIDEKEKKSWEAEFMEMFMALPDDTVLTIVDCHI